MEPQSKRTSSRNTTGTAQATHSFEIVGYSNIKGVGAGKYISSGTFTVGGYDWGIRFYPDELKGSEKRVSVYLELRSKDAVVRASSSLRLVNHLTGSPLCFWFNASPEYFRCVDGVFMLDGVFMRGTNIERNTLEQKAPGYIKDDRLTIECTLAVIEESWVTDTTGEFEIKVPPSDLSEHFGKLLLEEEGSDVAFIVGGENFTAHKIVLAARSPVFKAELYGQMKERRARHITIEDMQPDVFRALLNFIYTDSLSDMEDLDDDEYNYMIRHLLVAADRYAMNRLKMLCQSILGDHLDVENVASTLILADQHNCISLKDACIEFIATSNEMDAVAVTQGYKDLKRTCPSVLVDVFERTNRIRKA